MISLIPYELQKLIKNRSFILSVVIVFLIHFFLLWYFSLPTKGEYDLDAYRHVQETLSHQSDQETAEFLNDWKQEIEGVSFVRQIQSMKQSKDSDAWVAQELETHPGVFEKYLTLYQSGMYLRFSDSLEQEQQLLEEIYEEYRIVSGYASYLDEIKQNRKTLSDISIFQSQGNDFSSRNIEKSAEDYAWLDATGVSYQPSKSITSVMKSVWIDLLLFVLVLIVADTLITKEKEKRLFTITHCTKLGRLPLIGAKLSVLWIYCMCMSILFYGVALLFYGCLYGGIDMHVRIQSIFCYMESDLNISILTFVIYTILTKATVLFFVGVLVLICCIKSRWAWTSFLFGAAFLGFFVLANAAITSVSSIAALKCLNPIGWMNTDALYGGYWNVSLFQYPISRRLLSIGAMLLFGFVVVLCALFTYCSMKHFQVKSIRLPFHMPFVPHASLFRHEAYKMFVTNGALLVFVIFASLLVTKCMNQTYLPSTGEQYYQDLMEQLEGELTLKKEEIFKKEQQRFEDARKIMESIQQEEGIAQNDMLKNEASMTLLFYPSFQRVEQQYDRIKTSGGDFVYDSGYRYWFGLSEDVFVANALILTIALILIASGLIPYEYQSGMVLLLHSSSNGKRRVMTIKGWLCCGTAIVLTLLPMLVRFYHIHSVYPMRMMHTSFVSLPNLPSFLSSLPLWISMCLLLVTQIIYAIAVVAITLLISMWRKHQAQTIFFAIIVLCTPLILVLLGFDLFQWLSLLPLYLWPTL